MDSMVSLELKFPLSQRGTYVISGRHELGMSSADIVSEDYSFSKYFFSENVQISFIPEMFLCQT